MAVWKQIRNLEWRHTWWSEWVSSVYITMTYTNSLRAVVDQDVDCDYDASAQFNAINAGGNCVSSRSHYCRINTKAY